MMERPRITVAWKAAPSGAAYFSMHLDQPGLASLVFVFTPEEARSIRNQFTQALADASRKEGTDGKA